METTDTRFSGAIPQLYDQVLVPLVFQPYADDLAARAARLPARRVLELAAGTGVVTRRLAARLATGTDIVATDLNPAMLEQAQRTGTARPVQWRQADAMRLPFEDAGFDLVACQFGVMFFPDRVAALTEARRVLRPGGTLLYNSWGRIERNVFADVATAVLARMFPADPPLFLARTPHGYHDPAMLRRDAEAAGFEVVRADTVTATSRADDPHAVALAYCAGTPLRNEIEARAPDGLDRAIAAVAAGLAQRFGAGPIEGGIEAIVVEARAP